MLYVIGLGLSDETDVTMKGYALIKTCERVYLDAYTSILPGIDHAALEKFYTKKIELAYREVTESEAESTILYEADTKNIAFLVVGDPFGATTHTDLILRAKQKNIPFKVVHNASIMNAIGCTGLQLYNFGLTISMVFFTDEWRPDSWYDKIKINRDLGLHTLCLLDIKTREQSIENLARNRLIYEPPRFMTVNEAIAQLLEVECSRKENAYSPDSIAIGVARLGASDQVIKVGTLTELQQEDFKAPLHSLLLPSPQVHELEKDFMKMFAVNTRTFEKFCKVI
ncbi:diphthine synthase [Coelomomyces lativittatus]|nr:diphthine synthase [Coelomomyces lativittatus]KAJ1507498.1 diphthine synthase [Coelomomyces lativittatus]KAJ1514464.1 diphthine synthase [Coelomomyces lativittatus]